MGNSVTTTGTLALSDRNMLWKLYLEEQSYSYSDNTSTMAWSFYWTFNSNTGWYAINQSIMLQIGINSDYDVLDCYYIGTTKQTSFTSGKNYTTYNGTYRFPLGCDAAGTYTVGKLVGGSAAASSTVLATTQSSSLGTITVPHNSDGSGTATLKVKFGKYTGGASTSGAIKSFQSDTLTLTNTGGMVKVYNGSSWINTQPYVYNGSSWVRCLPYVYDGSSWNMGKG